MAHTITTDTLPDAAVAAAARRLYDAETALHNANATHVDAWISAAADRLHEAVEAYLAAIATGATN